MKRPLRFALATLLPTTVALCGGCEQPKFTSSMTLGGETYSAEQLTTGYEAYTEYCRPCHGDKGDGKGLSALALWPVPRDFTAGQFEFGSVPPGELPTDDDLRRIVRNGLAGTAMLAWDIPEPELDDIIGYVKTVSPRWQSEKPGTPVPQAADPWGSDDPGAVARGEVVYVRAGCNGCHATFVTKQRYYDIMTKAEGFPNQFDGLDPQSIAGQVNSISYVPTPKPSDVFHEILIPPDFTRDPIRSATGHIDFRQSPEGAVVTAAATDVYDQDDKTTFPWPLLQVAEPADVYRILSVGLNGAAMPSFAGAFPGGDKDLWAIAHYVVHLASLRDTPAAYELKEQLLHQPDFLPPAPPASAPATQPASASAPTAKEGVKAGPTAKVK